MIGIVIPAHNEAGLVGACLQAAVAASHHPALQGEEVQTIVVLDTCADATEDVVSRHPVWSMRLSARNVGAARAAGAQWLLDRGARWLAFTDADTRVAGDWLVAQLRQRADVVCGTVAVEDWSDHAQHAAYLAQHFTATYRDADGHRHVHGANLGVAAAAYRLAGGFVAHACSEDVALVNALQATGARIAWSAAPRVVTSARRQARAPDGFAAALCKAIEAALLPAQSPCSTLCPASPPVLP